MFAIIWPNKAVLTTVNRSLVGGHFTVDKFTWFVTVLHPAADLYVR